MFKDEYPNFKIDEIKFNHLDYINPVYQELIEIANYNNIDIKHITDIVDLGTYYIAQAYAWEITGWWWKQHKVNKLLDSLSPLAKNVDIISIIVSRYDTGRFI